jgi:malonyl-CoA/methylmalonyl-CoA synthetase
LHAGEIESALLSLPYISNAIVLSVEDEECQERAAAILQINPSFKLRQPDLETLRKDLTAKTGLMLFKLPTVVYWLHEGQEVSLTANGKVQKRDARKKFFGDGWRCKEGVEVLDLKGMEYWRMGGQC